MRTMRRGLPYALVYAFGWFSGSWWLFSTPSPDPWVRIPAAALTALIMLPFGALLWGWVFDKEPTDD